MLSDEPAPAPPTMNSCVNRSAGVLTGDGDPTHAYARRQRGGAQPVEPPRIGLDVHLAHQRLARHVARKRSEHRAVAGRLCVEKIGRGDARRRRHVLHDDGGLPGNMLAEVAREEAPGEVVVVAHRMPDDHADLLVLVELLRSLTHGRRTRRRRRDRTSRSICTAPLLAARLFRRVLANERRGCVVVALLARQQRLQADELVVVVERDELVLAGRERIAAA